MRNLWRFLRVPTLVRRIMVAQMLSADPAVVVFF
ncbi:Uncharacterised protein [Enterobacter cloacae]|uniref:Uncharacterized protein n=1 Tax=Enterobacter cloacae TaxID=550 RepID=A0A377M0X7_ENTCL|nr:Uncharacterised protein [Enterobacter cloacae]